MKDQVLQFCILYKGEPTNPYHPDGLTGDSWAEEYLKFQIWDAEYSFAQDPQGWMDTSVVTTSSEDQLEEAYKNCIKCKLFKMSVDRAYNWMEMYFNL